MLLDADGVRVTYGSHVAVADVSIAADVGVICLLGPNGAGKTSLMSVLAGARRPHAGRVRLSDPAQPGSRQARSSSRGQVGYLPQSFDLVSGMTVLDTVRYAAWCNLVPRSQLASATMDALEYVELHDRAAARVRTLSGGERQRLGLAAATAHRPALLLLDEPTVGLDPEQRVHFRGYVRAIAPTTCVVIATHLLEDSQFAADRVVVMSSGRICFDGSVERLAQLGGQEKGEPHESPLERGYRTALTLSGMTPA
jgi:ABC-2 type transport system ATP-binding protein